MERVTVIGRGAPGAKARGLAAVQELLATGVAPFAAPAFTVTIPPLAVIATGYFDRFMAENELARVVDASPPDDRIAAAFRHAALPADLLEALGAPLATLRGPLAVRSSSVLEDGMAEPFAGVYATRMLANAARGPRNRLREVSAAIQTVYASTFFARARRCRQAAGRLDLDEKMAVIIQEVAGLRHNGRFYPHLSGVARTWNFYPVGLARPEDGVIALALGLGRTIVEDGACWPCSPAHPHANPPYVTPKDLLDQTQKTFWAIDLESPPAARARSAGGDSSRRYTLADAEADGTLALVASTYSADDDRIVAGISRPGPRVVDFAPILRTQRIPLVALLVNLLDRLGHALGAPVEIEFAVSFSQPEPLPAQFALLQVRPLRVAYPEVEVQVADLPRSEVLAASTKVLGNGVIDTIRDVVYTRPSAFELRHGLEVARTLEEINRGLVEAGRPYVLIGFGRWGTSDPSAGIPAAFEQVAGARVIVETTSARVNVLFSQGSHFFLNLTSHRILYFSVGHNEPHGIDWPWLDAQAAVSETAFVRHVRFARPLAIRADGRTGRGVIAKPR